MAAVQNLYCFQKVNSEFYSTQFFKSFGKYTLRVYCIVYFDLHHCLTWFDHDTQVCRQTDGAESRKSVKKNTKTRYLTKSYRMSDSSKSCLDSWLDVSVERCQFIAIKNSEEYTLYIVARRKGSKGLFAFT